MCLVEWNFNLLLPSPENGGSLCSWKTQKTVNSICHLGTTLLILSYLNSNKQFFDTDINLNLCVGKKVQPALSPSIFRKSCASLLKRKLEIRVYCALGVYKSNLTFRASPERTFSLGGWPWWEPLTCGRRNACRGRGWPWMVVVIRDLQPLHILDQFRAVVAMTSASGHTRSCNNRKERY